MTVVAGRGTLSLALRAVLPVLCDLPCDPGAAVAGTHCYGLNASSKVHVSPVPVSTGRASGDVTGAELRLCPPPGNLCDPEEHMVDP